MKLMYEKEIRSLQNWINDVNRRLGAGNPINVNSVSVKNTCHQIQTIANGVAEEYPYYTEELTRISPHLFINLGYGMNSVNPAAFGELFVIIKHILWEPVNMSIWSEIHPRIIAISQELFRDGHFDSAAERAVKEVESRLRELFQKLKPNVPVPVKVVNIIGALLSENGAYQFADLSTTSGQNYRRGIQLLFEGLFAAYRNPSSHENLPCTRREAVQQITLASQLMYVLDKA